MLHIQHALGSESVILKQYKGKIIALRWKIVKLYLKQKLSISNDILKDNGAYSTRTSQRLVVLKHYKGKTIALCWKIVKLYLKQKLSISNDTL